MPNWQSCSTRRGEIAHDSRETLQLNKRGDAADKLANHATAGETAQSTKTMSEQLTTIESQAFELVQRQAKMLSSSTLIPKEFQGNMANCAIALNIANRLKADGFMVIQNLDVIHGRPSFRGKFLIAMVNASGRFSPLKFRFDGSGDDYGCTAYATDLASGDIIEGPKVDWNMVKGEGWLSKAGSKWKTMPELMFRYRAGAYFANIYAPDITLGMMTCEEAEDIAPIRDVTPRPGLAAALLPKSEDAEIAELYSDGKEGA